MAIEPSDAIRSLPSRGHGSVYSYQYQHCRCDLCRAANALAQQARRAKHAAEGFPKSHPRHGSYYLYSQGCRCERCRAAGSEYSRRRRLGG